MTKGTQTKATKAKASDPEREGNRYVRAARVLARDDKIDVKTLADRAFMSETTAARCLEAWQAVIGALIEVGRLPDWTNKAKPKLAAKAAATPVETAVETVATVATAPI